MENASRALIMAATVLIGIMLIGIFVYMFRIGARTGEQYETKKVIEQIDAFNSKFEDYQRNNNTISDVISAANLAYSINTINNWSTLNKVEIELRLTSSTTLDIISNNTLLKNTFWINKSNSKSINFYDLMSKDIGIINSENGINIPYTNETDKLTDINLDESERQYKYYFNAEEGIEYNERTSLIDKVIFILEGPNF